MTHSTDVATLTRWMAAEFSNQAQAFEYPAFFAHIRPCMRPLPIGFLPGVSLYLEQAYDYMLHAPYRIRVLNFVAQDDWIELTNYKVKDEQKFCGAARDRALLDQLTPDDVEPMPGCNMIVKWTGTSFKGTVQPGKACIVNYKGKTTYLDNEFEIDGTILYSL
ncbi:MAG: chromophore lyase CpcT/CpeT, partial [Leptolyngbyaceae bacterium]|nr:chromophore lyase CpcT/CpeT [Leptolyngbyaceae bacterium]